MSSERVNCDVLRMQISIKWLLVKTLFSLLSSVQFCVTAAKP